MSSELSIVMATTCGHKPSNTCVRKCGASPYGRVYHRHGSGPCHCDGTGQSRGASK